MIPAVPEATSKPWKNSVKREMEWLRNYRATPEPDEKSEERENLH